MKNTRLIFTITAILIAQIGWAQGLKKGNLIGLHTIEVTLKPGKTMDEFKSFFVKKVLPEYEKQWSGLKGYLVKGFNRRDNEKHKNSFAIIWLFESEAARNKYFDERDEPNELEKQAFERIKPIEKKLEEYGTYTVKYVDTDDWVVQ